MGKEMRELHKVHKLAIELIRSGRISWNDAIEKAKACKDKPTAVICKTVKGKGVSFMENEAAWHGTAPSKEQCEKALAEIGGDR